MINELSLQNLISLAPAIKSAGAVSTVSKRYTFISSMQVIEDMIKLGWTPVAAKQKRSKTTNPYGQHKVEFRIDKPIVIKKATEEGMRDDVIYPQVTFINSHDGKSSFRFYAGLFRLVCENGLSVPVKINNESFSDGFRIKHTDYTMESLRETMFKLVSKIVDSLEPIHKMQNKVLTITEARTFAAKALAIRNNIPEEGVADYIGSVESLTLDSMLWTKRREDEGINLWTVLNVVQEKVVEGGFLSHRSTEDGIRFRKAKKLQDMTKLQTINRRLFEEAEILL
jgi:hypothetical protein